MTLGMIWAQAHDRVIGRDNDLPWHLPEDLRRRNTIPPNATVQARLDIVDPGSEAVNYEVFLGAVD